MYAINRQIVAPLGQGAKRYGISREEGVTGQELVVFELTAVGVDKPSGADRVARLVGEGVDNPGGGVDVFTVP